MDAAVDPLQLDALIELQQVETDARRRRRELDELEAQKRLDAAVAERDQLARERDELVLERTEVDAREARAEREVATLRIRLDKERERLYSGGVTNAREEKSVQAEIKAVQDRIDDGETNALELLEQAEDLAARIEDLDRRIAEADASVDHLTGRRDEAAGTLLAAIAELEVDVERRRAEIDPTLLAEYDRVADKRPGRAIGRLVGDKCTSCQIDLPKAEASHMRGGPPLATCPNCGALLVTRKLAPTDPTAA